MQPFGRQYMGPDQFIEWAQGIGASAHLVGQRGEAEINALLGKTLALPVQRLVSAELVEQDGRQQVRTNKAHTSVYNTFNICRHLITAATKRRFRTEAFEAWRAAVGIAA